tara:strand:- start:471 stop:683 length:213 start_codon:yes stop_codon:yes gene_type:complete
MHKITKKGVFPAYVSYIEFDQNGFINFLDSNQEEIEEGVYGSDLTIEEVSEINESTSPKTRINFAALQSF